MPPSKRRKVLQDENAALEETGCRVTSSVTTSSERSLKSNGDEPVNAVTDRHTDSTPKQLDGICEPNSSTQEDQEIDRDAVVENEADTTVILDDVDDGVVEGKSLASSCQVDKRKRHASKQDSHSPTEPLKILTTTGTAKRSSTRIVKKTRRDFSPPLSPVKKVTPSGDGKSSTPETKTKRNWDLWTDYDKKNFFEGVAEHGKDFEAICHMMQMKCKKRGITGTAIKNKDQVRFFYYRTWNKISKFISVQGDVRKEIIELYGLINYGLLRDTVKLKRLNAKTALKLNELIENGSTTIRIKGKNRKIRTPACPALKKIHNQQDMKEEPIGVRVPNKVVLELVPRTNTAWSCVQSLAQNPRLKMSLSSTRTLSSVIEFIRKKWKPHRIKIKEDMDALEVEKELKLYPQNTKAVPVLFSPHSVPRVDITFANFREKVLASPTSASNKCKKSQENQTNKTNSDNSSESELPVPTNVSPKSSRQCKDKSVSEKTDSVQIKENCPMTAFLQDDNAMFPDAPLSSLVNASKSEADRIKLEGNEVAECDVQSNKEGNNENVEDSGKKSSKDRSVNKNSNESCGGKKNSKEDAGDKRLNDDMGKKKNKEGEKSVNEDDVKDENDETKKDKNGDNVDKDVDGNKTDRVDEEKIDEVMTDSKAQKSKSEHLIRMASEGFTCKNSKNVTLAEVLLVFGTLPSSRIKLEYEWCENVNVEVQMSQLANMLRRLSHLATMEFCEVSRSKSNAQAKEKTCSLCGVIRRKTQNQQTQTVNTTKNRQLKQEQEAASMETPENVPAVVKLPPGVGRLLAPNPKQVSTSSSDSVFRVPLGIPLMRYPATGQNMSVNISQVMNSLNPKQSNVLMPRNRRRPLKRQVIVQRTLLPKVPTGGIYEVLPANPASQEAVQANQNSTLLQQPYSINTCTLGTGQQQAGHTLTTQSPITIVSNFNDTSTVDHVTAASLSQPLTVDTGQTNSLISAAAVASGLSPIPTVKEDIMLTSSVTTSCFSSIVPTSSISSSSIQSTPRDHSISPPNLSSLLDISLSCNTNASDNADKFLDMVNSNTGFSGLLGNSKHLSSGDEQSRLMTPPHSPGSPHDKVNFSAGDSKYWLHGEGLDISLSSLLVDSPAKKPFPPTTSSGFISAPPALFSEHSQDSIVSKLDVDSTLQVMMNENSMDYVSKFENLAAHIEGTNFLSKSDHPKTYKMFKS